MIDRVNQVGGVHAPAQASFRAPLARARRPLRPLSQACSADGQIMVTPTAAEESCAVGQVLLSTLTSSAKISSLQASGLLPAALFDDACSAAGAGCAATAKLLRAALVSKWSGRDADSGSDAAIVGLVAG